MRQGNPERFSAKGCSKEQIQNGRGAAAKVAALFCFGSRIAASGARARLEESEERGLQGRGIPCVRNKGGNAASNGGNARAKKNRGRMNLSILAPSFN